jgi:hypothetical protein
VILDVCSQYMDEDGSIKTLTPELRARVRQYISKMASQGLRTLTLAMKDLGDRDGIAGTPFACFNGTKVQILKQQRVACRIMQCLLRVWRLRAGEEAAAAEEEEQEQEQEQEERTNMSSEALSF